MRKAIHKDQLIRLKTLLFPADTNRYSASEGNVESVFASRFLSDIIGIPHNWIRHQYKIDNWYADIAVVLNGRIVIIVECKRASIIKDSFKNPKKLRKAIEQAFSYALLVAAPIILATDGKGAILIENHEIIVDARTPEEIINNFVKIKNYLTPERLYYHSRRLVFPSNAQKSIKLYAFVNEGKFGLDFNVDKALIEVEDEFINEIYCNIFKDEIKGWACLWQHFKSSTSLDNKKQNDIIHIDCSFINYFQGSWYFDKIYLKVVQLERELIQFYPGTAIRVFVVKDRKQILQEYFDLKIFIELLLKDGYRISILYEQEWLSNQIEACGMKVDSHIDIVGSVFANVYFSSVNVLEGEKINNQNEIKMLREAVLNVVYQYDRIFDPLTKNENSYNEFVEWLDSEIQYLGN